MRPRSSSPDDVLWVIYGPEPPITHVAQAYRAIGPSRVLHWSEVADPDEERGFGSVVQVGRAETGYGMTVNVVSPALLWHLAREPAGVVIVQEINLIALYAVLTKLVRPRRRVVSMVEGDITAIGPTGSARWKVAFRRAVARGVDAFAANNADATRYLVQVLRRAPDEVVEGWWLAGFPTGSDTPPPDRDVPVVVSVGQLIRRKGHDLVITAVARHCREVGPVDLVIAGSGPDERALRAQAAAAGIGDRVRFAGQLDHDGLRRLVADADLMAFATRRDLVGRAAIESLSVGTPVLASTRAGGLAHVVRDGENALVVDPEDAEALFAALRRALDPPVLASLSAGALAAAPALRPEAAAAVLRQAIEVAQGRRSPIARRT